MAFHCVTTCSNWVIISQTEYSFLSKQPAMNVCVREPGSCHQTGYLNWFGIARVKNQGPRAISSLRMREVFKMSQGCHTCNQTAQHPVVKRPAVQSRQVPLMNRKFFRVDQVSRSKHHPLRSGHGPLALREV
jgi:hypothetical protein